MKKLLLIGGVVAAYFLFTNSASAATSTTAVAPTTPAPTPTGVLTLDQIVQTYNGKIVVDSNGYWTVIQNGKMRAASQADISVFPAPITVNQDVWALAAGTRPDLIAK